MSHKNSIFKQILQIIPRHEFEKSVQKYNGDFGSKGFSCWEQFVSMLYAQLSGQTGLRGVETGLESNRNSLYHLGVKQVKRSTLSYANNHRSSEVFHDVFNNILGKVLNLKREHKFRFKNPLYSVDASTIDLCLSLYDWATFRKKKGGIKLHVKLDHEGYLPSFVSVTTAKQHEISELRKMEFQKGDVVTFDRGYNDFNLFAKYCTEGIYFVTRLKKNADFTVVERKDVSSYPTISSDQIIRMDGFSSIRKHPLKLRRIRSKDPETGKYIVILTNNFFWSPKTIAAVYKDRWQIEIFFKTMKQNLKIKSFLGTSRNAMMIQIWIALIAFLMLKYLQLLSFRKWTPFSLMKLVPTVLFSYLDIWTLLNKPPPSGRHLKSFDTQLVLL